MSRLRLGAGASAGALLAGLAAFTFLTATPAFAHEQRTVGAYQLTVGWETEPTYTGVPNAVEMFVHDASGKPVDDLGPNGLKVQVIFGTQTSDPLAMEGSFDPDTGLGLHGQYLASIIPTAPGDVTFHFTGDINGQKIDEKFTSGPTTFNTVSDPTSVQYPNKVPTNGALADSINRINPRVGQAQATATAAKSSASSAKTLAIVAAVIGAIGLVLGGAALAVALGGRRNTPPSTS